MIQQEIHQLVQYGLQKELLYEQDIIYTTNALLALFQLDADTEEVIEEKTSEKINLPEILERMTDYAVANGICSGNTIQERDLFDTKIMGLLLPRPSEVIRMFQMHYAHSPNEATQYYYQFSQDSHYIRTERIQKDRKWITQTSYGSIEITINLSKPEKDPRAIAAAKSAKQSGYPKCLLCKENEGYAGNANHPARQNHRIIPITVQGKPWGLQYSPYVYYQEHCIVFSGEHEPMQIEEATFRKLFDIVQLFPHYFVGSNADLPIVGGSILSHDHFQGGNHCFAMTKAPIEREFAISGYESVKVGIVKWPMSVIRLQGKQTEPLIQLATRFLTNWRSYTDETVEILAETNGEPHNTITPIARKTGDWFVLDLVLRNNRTTKEHPYGLFHPHEELHVIKKENIGLIEVMGLAVLPARLETELKLLQQALVKKQPLQQDPVLQKYDAWVKLFLPDADQITAENGMQQLQDAVGRTFVRVLEQCAVFQRDEIGKMAFLRFMEQGWK